MDGERGREREGGREDRESGTGGEEKQGGGGGGEEKERVSKLLV